MAAFLTYIHATREFRQSRDGKSRNLLFLSMDKRHCNVQNQTISRWILTGQDKAGVDVSTFKAHSIRGATASTLRQRGVSLSRIQKRGVWKCRSVLKSHYLRRV